MSFTYSVTARGFSRSTESMSGISCCSMWWGEVSGPPRVSWARAWIADRGYVALGARNKLAGRVPSWKRASGSNVPPRRDPGCTGCRIRAWWRARRCEWSWCRRWRRMSRARRGGARRGTTPLGDTLRKREDGGQEVRRQSGSVASAIYATCIRRRRDVALAALDVRVQCERGVASVTEGEVARRDADRLEGGGIWGDAPGQRAGSSRGSC